MGEYGPASQLVDRLIDRVRLLTPDEAADLFRARAYRAVDRGEDADRVAHNEAARAAAVTGRRKEYWAARRAASAAWQHARQGTVGPWLSVGVAVADAAGALVVEDLLSARTFDMLFGPWQQAIGRLQPVGPGVPFGERVPALRGGRG
jgi:hypothetical protein